ncbi:staphylopine family metallophore export MFS transporter CntE [Cohnella sp. GCM10027633]|uniref:staphylopine family metallophore export MFS transporter CntE n=1 Tax=unclassified Cohnella TaxID=2636738 RepID=UPI00363A657E
MGALSRPYLRLYVLTLFYFGANAILNVILPLKAESLGADNATIGIVMGAYLFTTMFVRPWAGAIIDRYGPSLVLSTVLFVHGFALILYAYSGVEGYLVARMLQGACTAFFSMSLQIGIIDALPDKERSQGISLYSLCAYIPGIVGPLIAIGIWQSEAPHGFSLVMIVLAAVTGGAGYRAARAVHGSGRARGASPPREATGNVFATFVRNRRALRCGALMATASVAFGAIAAFVPLYAAEVEGGQAGIYLMLQAGVVVAARFALRKRIPSDGVWRSRFAAGMMLAAAAAALLVGLSAHGGALPFYAGAMLAGVSQALLYPALTTYLSFALPRENRNALLGLFIATADMGVSLGAIAMGPLADALSYSTMYMICGWLCGAGAWFAYRSRG